MTTLGCTGEMSKWQYSYFSLKTYLEKRYLQIAKRDEHQLDSTGKDLMYEWANLDMRTEQYTVGVQYLHAKQAPGLAI
jgi:hypothetical protein